MADTLTEAATQAATLQALPVVQGRLDVGVGKMQETPLIGFAANRDREAGVLVLTERFVAFATNPHEFIAFERDKSKISRGDSHMSILVQYTNEQGTGFYNFTAHTARDADMFIERADPDAWTAEQNRLDAKRKRTTDWLRKEI